MEHLNDYCVKRRQLLVGRAKKLFDEGMSSTEIAAELGISESTIRSIEEAIEKAKENGMK